MTKRGTKKPSGEDETTTKLAAATRPSGAPSEEESIGAKRPVILQIRGRPALKREIKRIADDLGVTVQTFTLLALRDYGVSVTDEDLLDLRKGENRALRSGIRKLDGSATAHSAGPTPNLAPAPLRGGGAGSARTACDSGVTFVFNVYAAKPGP